MWRLSLDSKWRAAISRGFAVLWHGVSPTQAYYCAASRAQVATPSNGNARASNGGIRHEPDATGALRQRQRGWPTMYRRLSDRTTQPFTLRRIDQQHHIQSTNSKHEYKKLSWDRETARRSVSCICELYKTCCLPILTFNDLEQTFTIYVYSPNKAINKNKKPSCR